MLTVRNQAAAHVTGSSSRATPPLENGDSLHSGEFLRRFEGMPEIKKAELIQGKVYMGSPVRSDLHGEPDNLVQTWLGTYAAHTPGVACSANATLILDSDNTFQPDAILFVSRPGQGGLARDAKGYLRGSPELVVEIAASSASIDFQDKMHVYRRCKVAEYILWRTEEHRIDWFHLEGDEYQLIPADADGLVRSRVFPGLQAALQAMLNRNAAAVLDDLHAGLVSRQHVEFLRKLEA